MTIRNHITNFMLLFVPQGQYFINRRCSVAQPTELKAPLPLQSPAGTTLPKCHPCGVHDWKRSRFSVGCATLHLRLIKCRLCEALVV